MCKGGQVMREYTMDYIMQTNTGELSLYKNVPESYAQRLCKEFNMLIVERGQGLTL